MKELKSAQKEECRSSMKCRIYYIRKCLCTAVTQTFGNLRCSYLKYKGLRPLLYFGCKLEFSESMEGFMVTQLLANLTSVWAPCCAIKGLYLTLFQLIYDPFYGIYFEFMLHKLLFF